MQQPSSTNTVLAQTSIQAPILSCTSVPSMIGHNSPIWTDNHIHDSMIMTGTESGFQTPPVQSMQTPAVIIQAPLQDALADLISMTPDPLVQPAPGQLAQPQDLSSALQEACKRGRQMSQRISDADKQSTAMVQQLVSVHSLLLEMTTQRDNLQTELLAVRQCLAIANASDSDGSVGASPNPSRASLLSSRSSGQQSATG